MSDLPCDQSDLKEDSSAAGNNDSTLLYFSTYIFTIFRLGLRDKKKINKKKQFKPSNQIPKKVKSFVASFDLQHSRFADHDFVDMFIYSQHQEQVKGS